MMEKGALARHLDRARQALESRYQALRDAAEESFGGRLVCRQASGGYFVYVHFKRASSGRGGRALPAGFTTSGLRSYCDEKAMGVSFMPASRCCVSEFVPAGEAAFGQVRVCHDHEWCLGVLARRPCLAERAGS